MRARALIIAAALVAGSAAAVSAAPPASVRTAPASISSAAKPAPMGFHPADFRSVAAFRAARIRILAEHQRAAQRVGAAAGQPQPVWGYGDTDLALPDVDGDGVGDVLSSRLAARTPALKVLSGRTGRTLWAVPEPSPTIAAIYVPEPGGKSIMVVLTDNVNGEVTPVAGVITDGFTVSAVNPKTGAAEWSYTINGTVEEDPAGFSVIGVGEFDGVLMRKNTTPYLLSDRLNLHFDPVAFATSVTPWTVDGTTGSVVHPDTPLGGDEFTFATPVGDLDGDGTDDYVVCAGGDVATVGARSGANGAPIWTSQTTSAAFLTFLVPSPDLSGDHKTDLLLGWFGNDFTLTAHAVNGTSGADVWSTAGDFAMPIGDIDHDGRSDTRVSLRGPRITFNAIAATGKRLWTRDLLTPAGTDGVVWEAGDVDGDHYADTYVEFSTHKEGTPPKTAAIVSGRTGASHGIADLGNAMGVSLRGGAPSFVRGVAVKKGYALTAYDGRSHRAFWHAVLKTSDVQRIATLDVVNLGHGRVGLLALLSGRFTDTIVLFDGRRGTTLWKSSYDTPGDQEIAFATG